MESEDEEDLNRVSMITDHDKNDAARELKDRLRSLRACYNLMKQHGNALQHTITSYQPELRDDEEQFTNYLETLSDRAILFGISSRAMLKQSSKYLESALLDSHRIFKMLQIERRRTQQLEKTLYDVAKQHIILERKSRVVLNTTTPNSSRTHSLHASDEEDNTETPYNETEKDADPEPEPAEIISSDSFNVIRRSIWMQSTNSRGTRRTSQILQSVSKLQSVVAQPVVIPRKITKQRRTRVPDRPNISVNAWNLLKNSIGKDLSKIPMPVNFNEPLSFLQRLTEEMEYAELLDTAANIEDKCEQIAYVAAFLISAYACSVNRTAKPFNPLLWETYECDRTDDRGWRSIAEQVSHHPPISAFYCEGRGWTCWQESNVKTKFKGKNLQVVPTGTFFCKFENTGNTYSWNKVMTTVNNIIVGKMWLDHHGDVDLKGHNTASGVKCTLTFVPYSMFSRETQRRVKGVVKNTRDESKFIVQGFWDSMVEIAPIAPNAKNDEADKGSFKTIWTRRLPEPGSEKYHNFSRFACELNELEEGVAPTDSRLRPDLRLMEQGHWDESNIEKLRLEQKQRIKRMSDNETKKETKDTKKSPELEHVDPHEPLWFRRSFEKAKVVHTYNQEYWKAKENRNWSRCPEIF